MVTRRTSPSNMNLDFHGVARNQALIVFSASIRWGRRLDRLVPGLSNKILLRQMRALRRYRTADEQVPG